MKKIALTRGRFALIDDEDFSRLSIHNWWMHGVLGYARMMERVDGKKVYTFMHRLVLKAKKGTRVDHKNGDTLDNRKINLRFCTHAENLANVKRRKTSSAPYKGIQKRKSKKPMWAAFLKKEYLGQFPTPELAALAYDKRAKEVYGEFAKTNF
mgnify:CR=1 FL=1